MNIARPKTLLAVLLAGGAILSVPLAPALAQETGHSFSEQFSDASNRAAQPRFRWWWPGAKVDEAELRREVAEMAAAGFGGFEIADVYDTISAPIDPKVYGWGTPRWNAAVAAVLDEATKHGMTVDLTLGPHWPSAVPSITPVDEAAAQELVHGQIIITGGASVSGALPTPILPPSGTTTGNPAPQVETQLLSVLAAQCVDDCDAADDAANPEVG